MLVQWFNEKLFKNGPFNVENFTRSVFCWCNDLIKNYSIMVLLTSKTLRGQYFLRNGRSLTSAGRLLWESHDKFSFMVICRLYTSLSALSIILKKLTFWSNQIGTSVGCPNWYSVFSTDSLATIYLWQKTQKMYQRCFE